MSILRDPSYPLSPCLQTRMAAKPIGMPDRDCVLELDQVAYYEFGVA